MFSNFIVALNTVLEREVECRELRSRRKKGKVCKEACFFVAILPNFFRHEKRSFNITGFAHDLKFE